MNPTAASQIALDNALVPPEARQKIGECNRRNEFSKPQREATYQITLDALKLSPCYPAFLITANVPEIYMHQFWNTVNKVQGNIETLPELVIDHMHQPWRIVAAVINGCISGKTTRLDKLKLSRAQILYGMYHCKNVDFIELLWEDFAFQIDNHFSKGSMPYPRFTKIIINYFISQNNLISMRNRKSQARVIIKDTPGVFVSKKKIAAKGKRSKGIDLLFNAALKEATQLKEATKQRKKYFHISHTSGSGDGTDFESGVPDEQHGKISDTCDNDDDGDNDESNDDGDNDDNDETNNDDDTKELYEDVNVDLGNKDANMTDAEQWGVDQHNVFHESGFEHVEEDARNIETLPELVIDHMHQPWRIVAAVINGCISGKTTRLDKLKLSRAQILYGMYHCKNVDFIELLWEDFAFQIDNHFSKGSMPYPRFTKIIINYFISQNNLISMRNRLNLHTTRDDSLLDHYIDNKLGEAIQKAITSHTTECKKEALAEKKEYIDLIDTSVRTIITEKVKTQPLQILPKEVSYFATPMIERNVIESLEATVLAKSSSQPKSTYATAALLSEFEFMKILMDKMEKNKSYLRADYKRMLYDTLIKSYNTNKYLFDTYGKVFTLKRGRDDKDKDQNPSAGSNRGTKRRKSSKEAESSRD
nr:hypothetical protein [Tanacetum cinerariifolium]